MAPGRRPSNTRVSTPGRPPNNTPRGQRRRHGQKSDPSTMDYIFAYAKYGGPCILVFYAFLLAINWEIAGWPLRFFTRIALRSMLFFFSLLPKSIWLVIRMTVDGGPTTFAYLVLGTYAIAATPVLASWFVAQTLLLLWGKRASLRSGLSLSY